MIQVAIYDVEIIALSFPHFSFILLFTCFQLPSTRFQIHTGALLLEQLPRRQFVRGGIVLQ